MNPRAPASLARGLRAALEAHLAREPACLELVVRRRTDPEAMPIEDTSVIWNEEAAPFDTLATITAPDQAFDDDAALAARERIAFDPWQALPEHEPLGRVTNRQAALRARTVGLAARVRRLTLCIALPLLAACAPGKLDPLPAGAVVLAFGDSLTAGNGVSPDDAYPAVLQRLIGRRVVNAGVSGETTARGLERLPGVLRAVDPDLMILLEGGNDILRRRDLATTMENLDTMIRQARSRDVQVVLVGVPRIALFARSAGFYATLAERHGLALQRDIIGRLLRNGSMKSDALHFNVAGYAALAEAIHDVLAEEGAL